MTDEAVASHQQAQLAPLWWFSGGVTASVATCLLLPLRVPTGVTILLVIAAAALFACMLLGKRKHRAAIMALVGLSLGMARGGTESVQLGDLEARLEGTEEISLRARVHVLHGWVSARWGRQTTVRVVTAHHSGTAVDLPSRCRLEVRNAGPEALPDPGSTFDVLARLRGTPGRPLLVVSSPRLLSDVHPPAGPAAWRETLARSLLEAAKVDPQRLRAGELAAALALGRRDLIPADRVRGWRRSGLAHALAVSGLHVGVFSAAVWLMTVAAGLRPRTGRLVLCGAVPLYALMAGASPSAMRATTMILAYLLARLLGRAIFPLAALMLAANLLLLAEPGLALEPGFQLTVGVTAALIRWAPPCAARLPLPRWMAVTVAVPLIAYAASLPIVAAHFRAVSPLAWVANLAVPAALTPAIPLSIVCTAAAPICAGVASAGLALLDLLSGFLWWVGTPGRLWTLTSAPAGATVMLLCMTTGWLAIRLDRISRLAFGLWTILGIWLLFGPAGPSLTRTEGVTLLSVSDGLAALVRSADRTLMMDGGRRHTQAEEMLAAYHVGPIDVLLASHGDEDHIGGLQTILERRSVNRLLVPDWLLRSHEVVPLLRAARRCGTRITPVARGSYLRSGTTGVLTCWPPAGSHNGPSNERSLVALVTWHGGRTLLTADIGHAVERKIAATTFLRADVLLVPHHGSRGSCSEELLRGVDPEVALIPAGPENRHNHPHPSVLDRLDRLSIPYRSPRFDGTCGARPSGSQWFPWPKQKPREPDPGRAFVEAQRHDNAR